MFKRLFRCNCEKEIKEIKELRKDLDLFNSKLETNYGILEERYRQNILALKEGKEISIHHAFKLPKNE